MLQLQSIAQSLLFTVTARAAEAAILACPSTLVAKLIAAAKSDTCIELVHVKLLRSNPVRSATNLQWTLLDRFIREVKDLRSCEL
jgi:hypothetical protein